jgi:TatD DNase family protein
MISYLDAHNHLQDEWLAPYRGEIFEALDAIGIGAAVVNGTNEADWPEVAALARRYRWIIPSYGMHPWYLTPRTPRWQERLLDFVSAGPCGIGEIGLDRWKEPYDIAEQAGIFKWQLTVAAERNLPVTIHCLKAWGALWDILKDNPVPERGFLLHSYGGPAEMLRGFIDRGAYFSFPGYFLGSRKEAKREIFKKIPQDRLLAETDAPAMRLPECYNRYPLPSTSEGQEVNHPANISAVYDGLAELLGLPAETLAPILAQNFRRLFGTPGQMNRG